MIWNWKLATAWQCSAQKFLGAIPTRPTYWGLRSMTGNIPLKKTKLPVRVAST
jgi:hypothetical protein